MLTNLEGQHAFLGASKFHWINYSEDKVADAYRNFLATQKGTMLHAFAAQCITLGQKLPKSQKTLNIEFPFSNESLKDPLLEMGEIKNETEQVVVYNGDAEIGVTITIHAIGEASNITIYNTGTREVMRIDTDKLEKFTGSGIIAGDEIIICTVKGNKSITLLRNGKTTNILNCLDKNADWFQLAKGDNIFAYTAEYGSTNLQFKIENRIVYEGV